MTHVYGTLLLTQEAQRQEIPKFIFTSTIAVYGTYGSRPMPLTEDMDARPDEFYGALKATAERALIDSGRFQILRLANVFGYGSGLFSLSSGVAGRFVERAAKGAPLRVFGDGSQSIDYVHIDDVCRAYELALYQPVAQNFVLNIGGGQPITIHELAKTVARVAHEEMGNSVEIEHALAPPDKIWPDRWLSIDKAERELGWQPQVSIEDGVREMLLHWDYEPVEV
jgi:UDP-glucose 4-epimerase